MKRLASCLVVFVLATAASSAQVPVPSHEPAARPASPLVSKTSAPSKPPVVAVVNGAPLLADRLSAAMNEVMPYGVYHQGARPERIAEIRKQALDKIVDEELQYQEAKRLALVAAKSDVDREYARVRRRYKTGEQYRAALERSGITTAEVRREATRRALIRAASDRAVGGKCTVTEAEARDYYQQNVTKFVMPEELHVFTLTVGVEPSAPRERWDEARRKAEDLRTQLDRGADFSELARANSTDENKENGGDLGYVHRGRLADEFERALTGAKAGTLVGPVETIYGFHLLRVTEVRPPTQRSFPEVRERLVKDLETRKCAEARDAWIRGLRERARIVIPDAVIPDAVLPDAGGSDTPGASPPRR